MIQLTSHPNLSYQPGRVDRFHFLVNHLPDGNPVSIPVQMICGERPGPRVVALAGVHGDELEGVRAIQSLMTEIDPAQLDGALLLIPVVNVMAFNACARRSPLDNVDLNDNLDTGSDTNLDFGGQLAYLWGGIGAEFIADFAPSMGLDTGLDDTLFDDNDHSVNAYMANIIGAVPFGDNGRYKPYVSGGLGAIQIGGDVVDIEGVTTSQTAWESIVYHVSLLVVQAARLHAAVQAGLSRDSRFCRK